MNATIREAVYFYRASLFGASTVSCAMTYRLERDGSLPKPVRLGRRIARWPLAEIDDLEHHAAGRSSFAISPPHPSQGGEMANEMYRLAAVRYSSEGAY
jgi:predicted DNA-binding transcriptional regulator AlpA